MSEFKHFSLVAGGDTMEGHAVPDGRVGPSVMSLKVWASSVEEAVEVIISIGNEVGFKIEQNVEVFRSKATQMARDETFAYDVRVVPCEDGELALAVAEEAERIRNQQKAQQMQNRLSQGMQVDEPEEEKVNLTQVESHIFDPETGEL